jgi:L-alanine-DL-glutamate epimerase-like enolase superfamily enzyme
LGVPIHRLLGGKFRDKVRIYADCHGSEALECLDDVLRSRPARWLSHEGTHVAKDYFGAGSDEPASTPEEYKQRALEKKAEGFTALKFDLDVPGTYAADPQSRSIATRGTAPATSLEWRTS